MADNFAITAGVGTTIAADVVGGAAYQRVKLALGADGTVVDAGAGSGAVGTDTQRVVLATDDPAVTILTALQKAEDAAHSSGDKGVMALSKRTDAAASSAGTDGDYATLNTDANGRLHTIDVSGVTIAAALWAEDTAHVSGDKGTLALTVRTDTTAASTAGTTGDYAGLVTNENGRLYVTVDPTLTALSHAEDAAHTDADTGILALVRRIDTPASSSGTSGDYSTANTDSLGRLWVANPHTVVSITPTIDTAIFAAGDAVGGKQTLAAAVASGSPVQLESLCLVDKGNQKPALDILFFDSDPTTATITNNAAFAFSTAISKFVGRVRVLTTDWITVDSTGIARVDPGVLKNLFLPSGSANLFVAVVLTSGTPTFLSTSDLTFKYGFAQK